MILLLLPSAGKRFIALSKIMTRQDLNSLEKVSKMASSATVPLIRTEYQDRTQKGCFPDPYLARVAMWSAVAQR